MRIAVFGHKRIPSRDGGIEVVVEQLATRMVLLGHEVVCYNRSGRHINGSESDKFSRGNYKGIKLKKVLTVDKKGLAAMTSSLFAAIRSSFSNADIVHIHAEGPAAMSFIPKLFGKKVIVTIHGLDWARSKWGGFATKYIKWGEKQAVKYADNIIVLSKNVQKYFKDTYNREVVFIPNGVNKPKNIPAELIKEKWKLEKDSYVLYLGRIVPEKGIQYLIEAWKNINTDKKLVICGGSSDTDEFMKNLKQMSSGLENIIFTGFQQGKALEELYSNSYIYCLPSDLEGMPLSLLEAMSYGNCCLVSNIDECTEVVEDKGVIFEKTNVKDLTDKLQQLLDNKKDVQKYKNGSARFICDKYNWDEVVKKTLELFEK